MKYCSHCGNQLADEAVICPKCGCPTEIYNQQRYAQNNSYAQNAAPANTPSAPVGERLSALSIIGFVFAFLMPLVGLICSIISFKMAKSENNNKTKSFSQAGIIISAVLLALCVLFWGLIITFGIIDAINNPVDYYYYY